MNLIIKSFNRKSTTFGLRKTTSKPKQPPKRKRKRRRWATSHRKWLRDSGVARTCRASRRMKVHKAMNTTRSTATKTTRRTRTTKNKRHRTPWTKKSKRSTLHTATQWECWRSCWRTTPSSTSMENATSGSWSQQAVPEDAALSYSKT